MKDPPKVKGYVYIIYYANCPRCEQALNTTDHYDAMARVFSKVSSEGLAGASGKVTCPSCGYGFEIDGFEN